MSSHNEQSEHQYQNQAGGFQGNTGGGGFLSLAMRDEPENIRSGTQQYDGPSVSMSAHPWPKTYLNPSFRIPGAGLPSLSQPQSTLPESQGAVIRQAHIVGSQSATDGNVPISHSIATVAQPSSVIHFPSVTTASSESERARSAIPNKTDATTPMNVDVEEAFPYNPSGTGERAQLIDRDVELLPSASNPKANHDRGKRPEINLQHNPYPQPPAPGAYRETHIPNTEDKNLSSDLFKLFPASIASLFKEQARQLGFSVTEREGPLRSDKHTTSSVPVNPSMSSSSSGREPHIGNPPSSTPDLQTLFNDIKSINTTLSIMERGVQQSLQSQLSRPERCRHQHPSHTAEGSNESNLPEGQFRRGGVPGPRSGLLTQYQALVRKELVRHLGLPETCPDQALYTLMPPTLDELQNPRWNPELHKLEDATIFKLDFSQTVKKSQWNRHIRDRFVDKIHADIAAGRTDIDTAYMLYDRPAIAQIFQKKFDEWRREWRKQDKAKALLEDFADEDMGPVIRDIQSRKNKRVRKQRPNSRRSAFFNQRVKSVTRKIAGDPGNAQHWQWLLATLRELGQEGMSSEESEKDERGRAQYTVRERRWRSRELLDYIDAVDFWSREEKPGKVKQGNPGRDRVRPIIPRPSKRAAIGGLPANFYDRVWLESLHPAELRDLKMKPAVPFPPIAIFRHPKQKALSGDTARESEEEL
ncbi:hypothetical protein SISNIDRAFT_469311 [Sistotremastrum niveocremeum HHB9708]|uniref:Uncharacterized protein n=1 Tax=Sistotremastrum niveocremeum HHB9708 TaxID=1314777 RepID=A0A164QD85_9AGAM|nr:hypothetical protein SISNIDRAFT_469311 [Sistotremastrum niveocremeum HHB9708]